MAGKPLRSRWLELVRGSLVDQLIRGSGHIDIYVVADEPGPAVAPERRGWLPHPPWRRYVWAVLLVAAGTLIGQPLTRWLDPAHLGMVFFLGGVVAAVFLGPAPSVIAPLL